MKFEDHVSCTFVRVEEDAVIADVAEKAIEEEQRTVPAGMVVVKFGGDVLESDAQARDYNTTARTPLLLFVIDIEGEWPQN